MDSKNKVIGFGGRVMGEGEPKYLNSPETMIFEKSKNLFGLNYARSSKKKNIIICEGYMDVISMHQAGFDQAVASLGTALTSGHVSLIKRYAKDDNFTKEVLVCYDSDNAGTKAAIKAISLFRNAGVRTRVINMKPYKDPDEFIKNLGAEAFQERIDNAQNSFMFELEILEKKFDLNDPGGKTVFLNEVASKLLVFGDELERNNYIDTVAAKYFVSPKSLQSLVVKYASLKGMNHSSEENEESEEKASVASRGANSSRREKDDGIKQAQRLLLTWLIEDERLYKPVSKYIAPVDFTDSMCYQVAVMLFEQFETGKMNPAMIINSFKEEETHREVAKLFNSELPDEMTKLERQKAIDDIVYRVKKSSLDERSSKANDIFELQKIIQEQAKLNSIHIKLE